MCKIKQLRYQCGHLYVHRPTPCAQAEPGEAYVCRRLAYLPLLQIKTYCAPCSKRQYCDQFYSQYKEFVESGADNEAVRNKWEEYEEACSSLDKMCSRDQPFWEHMTLENYKATGGKLDKPAEKDAPSEQEKRKTTEIMRYYLRRRQSSFPKPPEVKRDNRHVEYAPLTDADLLQQLFAKASLKKETVEESMDNLTLQEDDQATEPANEIPDISEGPCSLHAKVLPKKETAEDEMNNLTVKEDDHAAESPNEVPDTSEGVCTLLAATPLSYRSEETISKWSLAPGVEGQRQDQRCDIPVASHYGM